MNRPERRDPDLRASYTVAWICALEEEYFCACRMLDEEFSGPEISEDNDDNTYMYGRIAKHYVVIGCLPAGRYGTNSAARVARDMVRTFPHLRFALMVGIGGGAPSTRNDIRLGDVVVSQPRNGFGGVIQYDLGKLRDGHFQKTGQLNAPPEKLLGVIPEIRRLHSDKKKPDRLAEHLQLLNDMEDYQKPAVDRLYVADYSHVYGPDCDGCDPRATVERFERQNHRTLHVHYGTIASGNSVLKDAKVRDIYAQDPELNILCFEMEAAGLMNNVPCLVIRGICDYCDSHKNDEWHKYAALVAAAYARELLLLLRPQRVDAMPPWAERVAEELQQVQRSLRDVHDAVNDTGAVVQTLSDNNRQQEVFDKLPYEKGSSFDSSDAQHDSTCHPKTRVRLLHQIMQWAEDPSSKCIFWLNGMAGTGKSTISRTIAHRFKEKNQLGASFFFKRGEGGCGTAKNFFTTICKQLLLHFPALSRHVERTIHANPLISDKAMKEQFTKLLLEPLLSLDQNEPTTIVIIIDALDECGDTDDIQSILQLLPDFQECKSRHIRIFVTSRPELPIRDVLEGSNNYQCLVLHELSHTVVGEDIRVFIRDKFSQIKERRKIPSEWPGDHILETLIKRAVPLFISAFTICRFVDDPKWLPEERLLTLLDDPAATSGSQLDRTYLPILNQLLAGAVGRDKKQLEQEFQDTVGVIILLADPLSVNALAQLTDKSRDRISNRLDGFYSVLSVPENFDVPVRLLQLSFRDFLLKK